MARRSSMGTRSVLLPSSRGSSRRGGRRGRGRGRGGSFGPPRSGGRLLGRLAALLVLAAAIVGGIAIFVTIDRRSQDTAHRKDAAARFAAAWSKQDWSTMWRQLTPKARDRYPQDLFASLYTSAGEAAGVTRVRVGDVPDASDGKIRLAARVTTRDFGTLTGGIRLPVSGSGDGTGVDWSPYMRLPGLRAGESVKKSAGESPSRASILAADGTDLSTTGLGASIAGKAGKQPTGLQRIYDARLGGHPSERLRFGTRTIRTVSSKPGRTLRTTLKPSLMAKANSALGSKVGGVAVVRPKDGAVLALAGLAVSAPQPPGSTFKIITTAAALTHGKATPSTSFPQRSFATLSGTKLGNAGGETCGGTLTQAFIDSCNSVFGPLGAKVGATNILAMAKKFGFGESTKIPALKTSTIGPTLRDSLAVGAASIGQDRDLATPLEMATVGATIANDGVRVKPHMATIDKRSAKKVVSAKVAHQIRTMMLGVVSSGTGTAARISGVDVAGKTGTAELRPGSKDPKDADAWFVAFAPAQKPRVAVAVMLVGAGFGGTAAAPVAKKVLSAALG